MPHNWCKWEVSMGQSTFTHKPWLSEPDEWFGCDPDTGYATMILRNALGTLCGYVGVPEGHPLHGLPYHDWNATSPEQEAISNIQVHGGLTFAGQHRRAPDEQRDCWWFGFDCAHARDFVPNTPPQFEFNNRGCTYRDMQFVKGQIASLASQLHAIAARSYERDAVADAKTDEALNP
jgi:hypothetical protein